MAALIYFLNKIENCGCYTLTIDDGTTQTYEYVTTNCDPDTTCSCYLETITQTVTPPTAATYMLPDMYTPDGAVTADGSVQIQFNWNDPTSCNFDSFDVMTIDVVTGIFRSNLSAGIGATWPLIYEWLTGPQTPPFDNAEATALTASIVSSDTMELSGMIAIPYDGYRPVMNYFIVLTDYNGCNAIVNVEYFVPYELAWADLGNGACAADEITFNLRVENNSLTAIPAGTDFNISYASGVFTIPGTIEYVLEDVDYSITAAGANPGEIILLEDWLPGEVLAFNIVLSDVGCLTTGDLDVEFTQFNTTIFTPLPLQLTITIL